MFACLFLGFPAAADDGSPWYAGRLRVGTGVDYQTGDFGRSAQPGDTEVLVVPFSLEYAFTELVLSERDRLRVRVSVPWLRFEGPDRGENTNPDDLPIRSVDSGVGDVALRAAYLFTPSWDPWSGFEVSGRLKFPTASRSAGLGTGEFDYGVDGRLHRTFRLTKQVRVTPSGAVGYKWVGDRSGDIRRNSLRAAAGISLRVARRYTLGTRYRWRESSVPGRGGRHELLVNGGVRLGRFRISPYGLIGLSTRAADYGVGLRLSADIRIE